MWCNTYKSYCHHNPQHAITFFLTKSISNLSECVLICGICERRNVLHIKAQKSFLIRILELLEYRGARLHLCFCVLVIHLYIYFYDFGHGDLAA